MCSAPGPASEAKEQQAGLTEAARSFPFVGCGGSSSDFAWQEPGGLRGCKSPAPCGQEKSSADGRGLEAGGAPRVSEARMRSWRLAEGPPAPGRAGAAEEAALRRLGQEARSRGRRPRRRGRRGAMLGGRRQPAKKGVFLWSRESSARLPQCIVISPSCVLPVVLSPLVSGKILVGHRAAIRGASG